MDKIKLIKHSLKHPHKLINLIGMKISEKTLPLKTPFHPSFIVIEPSFLCNLDCIMCQRKSMKRNSPNLTFGKFKEILNKIPSLRIINLQGFGEPFLCKDFFKMVEYAHSRGVRVYTFSNATLIDKEMSQKIAKSNLEKLIISFDGANKETYEKIRKGANFEKILENLRYMFSILDQTKTPVFAWVTPNSLNIGELESIIETCMDLGFSKIVLQSKLSIYSYKKDISKRNAEIQVADHNAFLSKIYSLRKKYPKVEICDAKELSFSNPCKWPWTSLFISSDGNVVPCCVLSDPSVANMGNIFKVKSFNQIWNGQKFIELRRKIRENNLPFYCKDCYSK